MLMVILTVIKMEIMMATNSLMAILKGTVKDLATVINLQMG